MSDNAQHHSYVLKTETTGMAVDRVLSLMLLDAASNEAFSLAYQPSYPSIKEGFGAVRDVVKAGASLVSHSGFHRKALHNCDHLDIPDEQLFDTLVLAREHFGYATNKLSPVGCRLNMVGPSYRAGIFFWTPAMQAHCLSDAQVVRSLLLHILAAA